MISCIEKSLFLYRKKPQYPCPGCTGDRAARSRLHTMSCVGGAPSRPGCDAGISFIGRHGADGSVGNRFLGEPSRARLLGIFALPSLPTLLCHSVNVLLRDICGIHANVAGALRSHPFPVRTNREGRAPCKSSLAFSFELAHRCPPAVVVLPPRAQISIK